MVDTQLKSIIPPIYQLLPTSLPIIDPYYYLALRLMVYSIRTPPLPQTHLVMLILTHQTQHLQLIQQTRRIPPCLIPLRLLTLYLRWLLLKLFRELALELLYFVDELITESLDWVATETVVGDSSEYFGQAVDELA